jgi:hypothetical protein
VTIFGFTLSPKCQTVDGLFGCVVFDLGLQEVATDQSSEQMGTLLAERIAGHVFADQNPLADEG